MGLNKKYDGYKSYEYLEPDYDYKSFELADEINRVTEYKIPLTEEQEKFTKEIME